MGQRVIRLSYCLDCSADVRIIEERLKAVRRPCACPVCGSPAILSALPRESCRRAALVGYA